MNDTDLETMPLKQAARAAGFENPEYFLELFGKAGFKFIQVSQRKRQVFRNDLREFLTQRVRSTREPAHV